MKRENVIQHLWIFTVLIIFWLRGWELALVFFIGGRAMWYSAYFEMQKKQDQICELYDNWITYLENKIKK